MAISDSLFNSTLNPFVLTLQIGLLYLNDFLSKPNIHAAHKYPSISKYSQVYSSIFFKTVK